eukprot:GFKZ01007501.1.p2 GENE.GFKZ01007501.1~~GFKZ01007501.1.p2  ORF type:complete len:165 (+),score=7.81 GFKZ01007501.1:248-742(+)
MQQAAGKGHNCPRLKSNPLHTSEEGASKSSKGKARTIHLPSNSSQVCGFFRMVHTPLETFTGPIDLSDGLHTDLPTQHPIPSVHPPCPGRNSEGVHPEAIVHKPNSAFVAEESAQSCCSKPRQQMVSDLQADAEIEGKLRLLHSASRTQTPARPSPEHGAVLTA